MLDKKKTYDILSQFLSKKTRLSVATERHTKIPLRGKYPPPKKGTIMETEPTKFTKEDLQNIVSERYKGSFFGKEGTTYFKLEKDDDFDHDIIIFYDYNYEGKTIEIVAFGRDCYVDFTNISKALVYCNNYNKNKWFPTVFLDDDNGLMARWRFPINDALPKESTIEFVKDAIDGTVGLMYHIFVDAPNFWE